jgi:hypothetical protein
VAAFAVTTNFLSNTATIGSWPDASYKLRKSGDLMLLSPVNDLDIV